MFFPVRVLTVAAALFCAAASLRAAEPAAIASRFLDVDGVTLHYLTAGHGEPLILLHGYAETSRMWRPVMPLLAEKFTVDRAGSSRDRRIGDPEGRARHEDRGRAHPRAREKLGFSKARVVGHDIGLMVAYAYAAQFPSEVEKLVAHGRVPAGRRGLGAIYDSPAIWHFRFYGPTPEALVQGRERTYFEHFWNDFAADKAHSIPEADRAAYTAAYSRPGRMRAGFAYFESFPQTATDLRSSCKAKLPMPVLTIGGEKANGEALARQAKLVAPSPTTVVILRTPGTGSSKRSRKRRRTRSGSS